MQCTTKNRSSLPSPKGTNVTCLKEKTFTVGELLRTAALQTAKSKVESIVATVP